MIFTAEIDSILCELLDPGDVILHRRHEFVLAELRVSFRLMRQQLCIFGHVASPEDGLNH